MTKATECRNFVIAGHAGSGKSTLSELMLYKAGAIGRPGTVDAKNTVSDFMADEQERRASIYSTCMNCMWKNNQFFFVDTPGYGEFIGQAAAAVRAADAALVVIDVYNEINAVREANKLNIPIVAIVDTNGDPSLVDYPVAANDDAVKSVQIITNLFAEAIKVAREIYRKKVTEERDAAEAAKKVAQEKADDAEREEKADKPRRAPRRKPAEAKAEAKSAE